MSAAGPVRCSVPSAPPRRPRASSPSTRLPRCFGRPAPTAARRPSSPTRSPSRSRPGPSTPSSSPTCCSTSPTRRWRWPRPRACCASAGWLAPSPGPGSVNRAPAPCGTRSSPTPTCHRPRRADAGLDRPGAVEALLRSAGLRPERIWCERLRRQWDRSSFWDLATGSGVNRVRLSLISAPARAAVLARANRPQPAGRPGLPVGRRSHLRRGHQEPDRAPGRK
jgi:hypothetical protein